MSIFWGTGIRTLVARVARWEGSLETIGKDFGWSIIPLKLLICGRISDLASSPLKMLFYKVEVGTGL